jgi:nitrite reductase (NADH) small subunit
MSTATTAWHRGADAADITDPTAETGEVVWTGVCALEQILQDTGVAALVDGRQIAIFRLRDGSLHAIDNHDPCSGANVLARGIVGDAEGEPVVASPVHKQRFVLGSGRCLDADTQVAVHPVRVREGRVEVGT